MDTYIGAEVYTTDGSKLGQVKEVRDQYFKVDASMRPDYWLHMDCVRGGTGITDRVTVSFDKDHIDEHKVDLED